MLDKHRDYWNYCLELTIYVFCKQITSDYNVDSVDSVDSDDSCRLYDDLYRL